MRFLVARLMGVALLAALFAAGCDDGNKDAEPTATPSPAAEASPTSEADVWRTIESDPAPELPGVLVDLQSILGGYFGAGEGVNTAAHVSRDVDYSDQGLPPAGGPHWSGACGGDPAEAPPFCGPAPWGVYRATWDEETVVHNMEHGGVVVWYNLADEQIRDQLEQAVVEALEDGHLVVMMPYAEIDEGTIALTSWARRETFSAEEFTPERVRDYIDIHDRRFNPERF